MYKPIDQLEEFDDSIDKELLSNDFSYYDDWEYGPMSGWEANNAYYTLKLMKHSYGYWIILCGGKDKINVGSSNNAKNILNLRSALQELW